MEKAKLDEILANHKKWLEGNGGERADLRMEKFNKFFSYDEGKVALHPPFMGSDCWSLRSSGGNLLFSIEQFQDFGSVLLEDGEYVLNLVELDDYTAFSIKFGVKGRQIIIEDVSCRNCYKRSLFSIMPDRGIYIL